MFNFFGLSNVSAYNGNYNAYVEVQDGENGESVLRRFRRQVMSSNCIYECRRRRTFEDPQDIKKRKIKEMGKKKKMRNFKMTTMAEALARQARASGANGRPASRPGNRFPRNNGASNNSNATAQNASASASATTEAAAVLGEKAAVKPSAN